MSHYSRSPVDISDTEREHSSPSVAAGSRNSSSAGAPKDFQEILILQRDMRTGRKACFGGWLFNSTNHRNYSIVCHAIQTEKIREEIGNISEWYRWINANIPGLFLPYEGSINDVDGCTCFKFSLGETARSMREIMKDPNRINYCANLFVGLVSLLNGYNERCRTMLGRYSPLCCFSLDTVFLDHLGQIRVLPLICFNDAYPRGFPMEVGTEEVNETTDLYTAALLTYQVFSGCEFEKPSEGKCMQNLNLEENALICIDRSMNPFASRRMSLQEVCNYLGIESGSANVLHSGINSRSGSFAPEKGIVGMIISAVRRKLKVIFNI